MPNNGYIGRSPGDAAVIVARESFTPGAATTDFTFASGYTVGYIDCYLNGVRQVYGTDYTASNGTTVGLTSFAQSGDVIELIAYKAFNVGNVTNASGDFIVGNKLTVSGISSFTDVVSSGIITADSFSGNLTGASVSSSGPLTISDSTASTSTTTGALIVTGGVGVAKSIFVGEGISIAGTITYNDVTNIDSVGLVTAGKGLRATTGGLIVTAGVSTFAADIGGKDGVQGLNVATALKVTGVSTFVGLVTCADVVSSGIITADSYYGSGANLSGVGVVGVNTAGFSTFKDVAVSGIATFKDTVDVSLGILTAPGIIAQTAQYNNNGRSIADENWTGVGSQTITPTNATTKILVLVSMPFGLDSSDAAVTYILANFRLTWNHSGISETQLQHKRYSLQLPEDTGTDMIIMGSCEIMFLHDHNTTNEITYEVEAKTAQSTTNLEVISGGSNTDDKTITLLEICT